MKWVERLVMTHINTIIPATLNPLQQINRWCNLYTTWSDITLPGLIEHYLV
jgi:hypothetical protein